MGIIDISKINKFWGKMKMMFLGISMTFLLIFMIGIFKIEIHPLIFLLLSFVAMTIAIYSNWRRLQELKETTP